MHEILDLSGAAEPEAVGVSAPAILGLGALPLQYWMLCNYIGFETDIAKDFVSANDD